MSAEERKNRLMYRGRRGGGEIEREGGRERETALSPAEREMNKYDKYDN